MPISLFDLFKFIALFVFILSHERKLYKNNYNKAAVHVIDLMRTALGRRLFHGKEQGFCVSRKPS